MNDQPPPYAPRSKCSSSSCSSPPKYSYSAHPSADFRTSPPSYLEALTVTPSDCETPHNSFSFPIPGVRSSSNYDIGYSLSATSPPPPPGNNIRNWNDGTPINPCNESAAAAGSMRLESGRAKTLYGRQFWFSAVVAVVCCSPLLAVLAACLALKSARLYNSGRPKVGRRLLIGSVMLTLAAIVLNLVLISLIAAFLTSRSTSTTGGTLPTAMTSPDGSKPQTTFTVYGVTFAYRLDSLSSSAAFNPCDSVCPHGLYFMAHCYYDSRYMTTHPDNSTAAAAGSDGLRRLPAADVYSDGFSYYTAGEMQCRRASKFYVNGFCFPLIVRSIWWNGNAWDFCRHGQRGGMSSNDIDCYYDFRCQIDANGKCSNVHSNADPYGLCCYNNNGL